MTGPLNPHVEGVAQIISSLRDQVRLQNEYPYGGLHV